MRGVLCRTLCTTNTEWRCLEVELSVYLIGVELGVMEKETYEYELTRL